MGGVSGAPASVVFGRFRVVPHRRDLLADGQPIKLGGRAYDVLMVLIEANGAVVSKDALMDRVWPGRAIEENALQVQITALRAAFGPERGLIRTVSGRGYQFTGKIRVLPESDGESSPEAEARAPTPPTNLPEPVSDLIGRDDELRECVSLVRERRLVTLTGAGGIGKTRLGLAVAHRLLAEFVDGAWLVELSPLADPSLVPATVATAFGLDLAAGEVTARGVARALAGRRSLLVLDTCEHVIDAAAAMAESLLRANPRLRLIATSREALKAEGEWIYPVPPLDLPTEGTEDHSNSLQYGGVKLFYERARAVEPRFAPDQRQATIVAAICRRLDGMPLAIELAAARVPALGIGELSAHLDDRFNLLTGARRTALPRHQTLRATLDWSHDLLPESERTILRRLAVFTGIFSLEAAGAIVTGPDIGLSDVINGFANLVTKSLVSIDVDRNVARHRLLDTTWIYAREKLDQSGELDAVSRRHAEYCIGVLERAASEWGKRPMAEWLAHYGRQIDDLRAALDWAFSPHGDAPIGVALTVASERLWFSLSLMDECRTRIERALARLPPNRSGSEQQKMRLFAILAVALFNTKGPGPGANAAWQNVLDIAERLHDAEYRLRALWGLWYNHISHAECQAALTLAQRYHDLPPSQADPSDRLVGQRMLGTSLYYLGELSDARHHLEHVIDQCAAPLRRTHMIRFQFDLPVATRGTLARVVWLQGFPDQAVHMAKYNVEDAYAIDNVVSLYWALDGACMVGLAAGDQEAVERSAATLLEHSARHALGFWQALGCSYEGQLMIERGNAVEGVRRLRDGLDALRETRYILRSPGLLGALAEGMAEVGPLAPAQAVIDEALAQCETSDERWSIAELLRIKGELLLAEGGPEAAKATEDHFRQSLDWARRQGALSWELRTAISFARLLRDLGRSADAVALLQPVYARFTEGFDTADLMAASALLDVLQHGAGQGP
jgi:predicted ATPase/DNA-binding winged helix-turn-helix (wHTH) protein